ncbi:MAG: metalloregulator ArsR/SmtB family transcription factor [Candidatus Lokiarchaeota archaeon]|nr:metalloregulator ArsR/SmtB family transcription factor [Candidatus Lokiarchaeota archaeon]MBD3200692.1 metalloregulator ArsR/SmtB family transcription factor [Candidatus Lokiarchaeota archaeon]
MDNKRQKELIVTLESCVDMKNVDLKLYFEELKSHGKNISANQTFKDILGFCSVLGNEERLKIIEILKQQDYCVCELEVMLDKSQPTISHHLRELERIGLIGSFKKGRFTHYDINPEKLNYYLNLIHENFISLKSKKM